MRNQSSQQNKDEDILKTVTREVRSHVVYIAILSIIVNMLMFTGPVFMLVVYDRVLNSGSVETLISLVVLVLVLYAFLGALDYLRGRISSRIGEHLQNHLDATLFGMTIEREPTEASRKALGDLETIQKFMSSPLSTTIFDLIWAPIFILAIFMLHPWMGFFALGVAIFQLVISLINRRATDKAIKDAQSEAQESLMTAQELARHRELIISMGMQSNAKDRWAENRGNALNNQMHGSDYGGFFQAISKTTKMFAQSAILGLGAFLVIRGEIAPGVMIAGSILVGRALAPIELMISQWPQFVSVRSAWKNLVETTKAYAAQPKKLKIPRAKGGLSVENLSVMQPGASEAYVKFIGFEVKSGECVGVIGPSGSGKTTLAKALVGLNSLSNGKMSLGGASFDQYDSEEFGRQIGYVPQAVQLFTGTIAENIGRLDDVETHEAEIVEAAELADAHGMITSLPDGYGTNVSTLSGGQSQRVALARALYGDPALVILDEPNSNLDANGTSALNGAIIKVKERGGSVIVIAHRPNALSVCERVLILDKGVVRAFGPTQDVMKDQLKNYNQIASQVQRNG